MKLKEYFYILCVWITLGSVLYVLGAFVASTWDSSKWYLEGKVCLVLTFLFLLPLAWTIIESEKHNND